MEQVSIIVPVYNALPYLTQCLDSILAQHFKDFQLILIDDGSTDGSGAVCEAYKQKDERICVIHQENQGVSMARNEGLHWARGKYVMFIDPDDWIEESLLEQMNELACKEDLDWVIWSLEICIFDETQHLLEKRKVQAKPGIYQNANECRKTLRDLMQWDDLLLGVPWNKFYRREIIEAFHLRFPPLRRRQDIVFNLKYYSYVKRMALTSTIYSYYRVIDRGYEHKAGKDSLAIAEVIYQTFQELLSAWGSYQGESRAWVEYHYLCDVLRSLSYCHYPQWHYTWREKYTYIQQTLRTEGIQQVLQQMKWQIPIKGRRMALNYRKIKWMKKGKVIRLLLVDGIEAIYAKQQYVKRRKK